jgi:hypothetical protein
VDIAQIDFAMNFTFHAPQTSVRRSVQAQSMVRRNPLNVRCGAA